MVATIGVKIANGEFYPIVDENSSVKKRLVLTTVHDKQESVQIDLYKSYTRTMADGLYIGSLVVEEIRPRSKGEPSIELIVSCDAEGHISAEALDLDTGSGGQHQFLSVSLKSLDESNRDLELPDFELESPEGSPGLYGRASAIRETQEETKGKKKGPWLLIIVLGLLVILAGLALFFFLGYGRDLFNRGRTGPVAVESPQLVPARPLDSEEPAPVQSAEPAVPTEPSIPAESSVPAAPPAADPAPVRSAVPSEPSVPSELAVPAEPVPPPEAPPPPLIEAPARPAPVPVVSRTRNPPVASYRVPATIPRNGVAYRIRWGDTLWDIAEAFYRDPWLYPRIARFNGIRNPDRIISGTTIRVPPKN
jgi:hypothetical protein